MKTDTTPPPRLKAGSASALKGAGSRIYNFVTF